MSFSLILRWVARLLSVGLAGLFVAFALGEEVPPPWPATLNTLWLALLVVCLASLLYAWRSEIVGAVAALVSGGGFYLLDFYQSQWHRLPGGWVFPLLLVTAIIYLLAAAVRASPGAGFGSGGLGGNASSSVASGPRLRRRRC
jgi:hypothetical protein